MPLNFNDGKVYWQAHRGGGGNEMPDNTLASVEYGWTLGGIPEIDMRLTADHELVCLHDDTLARTTDAPPAVANVHVGTLSLAEIRHWDAGIRFHAKFKGQKVPALREILAAMRGCPGRLVYADLKNYDSVQFPVLLAEFARLAAEFEVAPQIIACSCDYALNCQLKESIPGLNVMHWIGYWGDGNPAREKMNQFRVL
ncbi:MAG: glycerophosphodiester phosphodiesterase family protein, partial [Lentisphaeria bacterium]